MINNKRENKLLILTELGTFMTNMYMKNEHIVAIIRGVEPSHVVDVGRVLLDAGIHIIEVPLNSPDPITSIALLADACGDRALIGAGTVLHVSDVDNVYAAGGKLVVSPNTNVDVIKRTKEKGMVSMPGFATASEAFAAIDAGADALKLFPAGEQGHATIKALKSVLPAEMRVFAVGGVGPDNMQTYAQCGADGFGLGTSLYTPGMSLDKIATNAHAAVAACSKAFG